MNGVTHGNINSSFDLLLNGNLKRHFSIIAESVHNRTDPAPIHHLSISPCLQHVYLLLYSIYAQLFPNIYYIIYIYIFLESICRGLVTPQYRLCQILCYT